MTDDLTPEEREALQSLPRERTPPAGLEDRVVAAMRQQGHLARKPARVIRITSTRVAGLLAACLVLMVGAYSIGLHRGVDNNVLKNIEPSGINASGLSRGEGDARLKQPAASEERAARQDAPMSEPESAARDEGTLKSDAPPLEWKLETTQLVVPKDAKKEQAAAKENEVREGVDDALARSSSRVATPPPAPATSAPAQMKLQSKAAAEGLMKQSRTFALNGGTLIVDAPDSVRVVQDAQGRTLLIYTSDGIIRIRLAD